MNLNLTWLIERDTVIDSDRLPEIIQEIQNQGMICHTFEKGELIRDSTRFDDLKDCIILLGSIDTVSMVQRIKPWIPGTIANFRNFDCMTYYAYYGKYTPQFHHILPLAEGIRYYRDKLPIFVRPCSGRKPFSGQIIKSESDFIGLGKPDLPVVCRNVINIASEYRLFCSGTEILGASAYMSAGNPFCVYINHDGVWEKNSHPGIALNFVQNILNETDWRPDGIFTIDVGITNVNIPFLIEINSFSCSGWYMVDPIKIIAKTKELAIKEYQDLYS